MTNETNAAILIANKSVVLAREALIEATAGQSMPVDQVRTLDHAKMRLNEALMLLGLAEGVPHKLNPGVQHLHQAIAEADAAARALLDEDVVIDGLAEMGYNQWRCLSALALMHMSAILDGTKKGGV